MKKLLVIKLGGILLNKKKALIYLAKLLKVYNKSKNNISLIIVHGGGYLVDSLLKKLSMPIIKHNGLRITPSNQIDIITGVLSGTANKILLALAKKYKINAIGLCLSDGNIVNVEKLSKDTGNVGYTTPGSPQFITNLLNFGYIPIISSIGITSNGTLMNVNADYAATTIALTLKADVIFLSNVNGILDNNGNSIKEINTQKASQLINDGTITNGMIIKVNSAIQAVSRLKRPIFILNWKDTKQLFNINNQLYAGTKIIL